MKKMICLSSIILMSILCVYAQSFDWMQSPYTNLSVPETRDDENGVLFPNTTMSDAGVVISSRQIMEKDPYGSINDAGAWNDWIVYNIETVKFSDGHTEERKTYIGRKHLDESGNTIVQW